MPVAGIQAIYVGSSVVAKVYQGANLIADFTGDVTLEPVDGGLLQVAVSAAATGQQTFEGVGWSADPVDDNPALNVAAPDKAMVFDWLVSDIGANSLRLWGGPGSFTIQQMIDGYVGSGLIAEFLARATGDIEIITAFEGFVEGDPTGWAATVAQWVADLVAGGIPITAAGYQNEPGADGRALVPDADMVSYAQALRSGLDGQGLSTIKIFGPDYANHDGTYTNFASVMTAGGGLQYLHAFAGHTYQMGADTAALAAMEASGKWEFQTESGSGNVPHTAARFIGDLNHGIRRWWFFLATGSQTDGEQKLVWIDGPGAPARQPYYYTLKHLANAFVPGTVIRKCTSDLPDAAGGPTMPWTYADWAGLSVRKPKVHVTVGRRNDGYFVVAAQNGTHNTGSTTQGSAYWPGETLQTTVTVPELASFTGVLQALRTGPVAGTEIAETVNMVAGVARFTLAEAELLTMLVPIEVPPPVEFTWTPADFPELTGWWDMTTHLAQADGTDLVQFTDLSGTGAHFDQRAATALPDKETHSAYPSLELLGAESMDSAATLGATIGFSGLFAIVVEMNGTPSSTAADFYDNNVAFGDSSGYWGVAAVNDAGTPSWRFGLYDTASRQITIPATVGQRAVLLGYRTPTGDLVFSVNGAEPPASVSAGNLGGIAGVMRLGINYVDAFFSGWVYEIVTSTSNGTNGQRAGLLNYLMVKWGVTAPSPIPAGYTMTFEDDFDGASLNTDVWNYRLTNYPGYQSTQQAENVDVAGGLLRIHKRKESAGGKEYTGGGICSIPSWDYGYFEARIRMGSAIGFHPGYWTTCSPGPDFQHADCDSLESETEYVYEIDIMEHDDWGNDTVLDHSYSAVIHTLPESGFPADFIEVPNLTEDFHVFGCLHTPNSVKFYLDDRFMREYTYAGNPGIHHLWLSCISLTVQTVVDTDLPDMMEVDWVRVWSAPGAAFVMLDYVDTGYVDP